MTEDKDYKYEEYIDSPLLQSYFPEPLYNYMSLCGDKTAEKLGDVWKKNIDRNLDKFFGEHGPIGEDLIGFAKNKAVILVGAGPSFNNNKDVLKRLYDFNTKFDLQDQPFVIIASNHQLKPLLDMGIFPHFTLVLDAGNHFRHQFLNLNTDMKCIMIANIAADHKMLKRWHRDGHTISFFMSDSTKNREYYEKKAKGRDPERICTFTGGNVLNLGFALTLRYLHSRFIIVLGNDLSFPMLEEADERRAAFYSDGDYSTNDKDEAKSKIAWMAYSHAGKSTFDPSAQLIDYTKVLTSHQLLIYKAWIEMHVAKWSQDKIDIPFRYYNCSEGGITGVLAKKHAVKDLEDPKNWTLMDELAPDRWFTKPLIEAAKDFLEIKQACQQGIGVGLAGSLQPVMGGANGIVQRPSQIVLH
jgi:hypothetical protein